MQRLCRWCWGVVWEICTPAALISVLHTTAGPACSLPSYTSEPAAWRGEGGEEEGERRRGERDGIMAELVSLSERVSKRRGEHLEERGVGGEGEQRESERGEGGEGVH